eukprot:jgi/Mesvir1/22629/Mv25457-RA.1
MPLRMTHKHLLTYLITSTCGLLPWLATGRGARGEKTGAYPSGRCFSQMAAHFSLSIMRARSSDSPRSPASSSRTLCHIGPGRAAPVPGARKFASGLRLDKGAQKILLQGRPATDRPV